jgi:hypothetical protein
VNGLIQVSEEEIQSMVANTEMLGPLFALQASSSHRREERGSQNMYSDGTYFADVHK